jgi:diaminohydroxyphosphoribosylaminopyrimidine deaminase/5-amino-6-(5-phosphoribosylamino)uracil reductase
VLEKLRADIDRVDPPLVAGFPGKQAREETRSGADVRNATIYVTLEPCNHTGRTPPCTEKILSAGIQKVVVAMADPNPDVTGGGNAYLEQKGPEVVSGVCEAEARQLNEVFVKFIRTRRPFVVLKCAATLDGQIATRTGDSKWVTGELARKHVHLVRHAMDAILVGAGTVIKDDPSLTTRLGNEKDRDPHRVILDTRLSIPSRARLFQQASSARTYIAAGPLAADKDFRERRDALEAAGAVVLETPLRDGRVDMDALMDLLGEAGITSLLIEGGGQVIGSALSAGIVDKVMFYYAPKILGGSDGVPICAGRGPDLMKDCFTLKDTRVERFGEDVLIEGYIDRG